MPYFNSYRINEIQWLIPDELMNNKIVFDKMNHGLFEKLLGHIDSLYNYELILSHKYLDAEKEKIKKQKEKIKEQCFEIIQEVDSNMAPYHWEMEINPYSERSDCYLIGLFKGENRLRQKIISI